LCRTYGAGSRKELLGYRRLTYLYLLAGTEMDRDIRIRWALAGDVDAIARVVNVAFRRAESFFVERDRIDEDGGEGQISFG
jgi:hypothetical protein